MKNRISIAAGLFACACLAHANEGLDLAQKSKTMAAASTTKSAPAPFVAGRDPLPEIFLVSEQERRGIAGQCESAVADLCYDAGDGRLTYRGARHYMPQVNGLTAEGIVLRRDRVVFRYSFK